MGLTAVGGSGRPAACLRLLPGGWVDCSKSGGGYCNLSQETCHVGHAGRQSTRQRATLGHGDHTPTPPLTTWLTVHALIQPALRPASGRTTMIVWLSQDSDMLLRVRRSSFRFRLGQAVCFGMKRSETVHGVSCGRIGSCLQPGVGRANVDRAGTQA
jgi:hypothetical protein